jgi:hypothetical protein
VLREAWDSFDPAQRTARLFTRIGAQLSALSNSASADQEGAHSDRREKRLPG